nr:hypothetical protein [Chloroflexota bacterium]
MRYLAKHHVRAMTGTRLLFVVLSLTLTLLGTGSSAMPAEPSREAAQKALTQAGLSLSPAELTVAAFAPFSVDIMVHCGDHADGVATELSFNPAYLQVVSIVPDTSQFVLPLRNTYDNQAGIVRYDAGAALDCRIRGTCPTGIVRIATVNLRVVTRALPVTYLGLRGQMSWGGANTFDGVGSGSTITILLPSILYCYLPLIRNK